MSFRRGCPEACFNVLTGRSLRTLDSGRRLSAAFSVELATVASAGGSFVLARGFATDVDLDVCRAETGAVLSLDLREGSSRNAARGTGVGCSGVASGISSSLSMTIGLDA